MPSELIQPLNTSTFNKSNITFAKPYDSKEYGFRQVSIGYHRDDTTDDKCTIKIKGRVLVVFPPNEYSRNYSALLSIEDKDSIELLQNINTDFTDTIYSQRKNIFNDISIKGNDAVSKLKTKKTLEGYRKKPLINYNSDYNNHSIIVQFRKDIIIRHTKNIPEEIKYSDDILKQLSKGTEVVIISNLNNISINLKNLKWHIKLNAIKFSCVDISDTPTGDPSALWGIDINNIDINNLVFKNVNINEKYKSKNLPIKYNDGKEHNLTINLNNVKCFYLKNEPTQTDGLYRFTVAITFDDNSKFNELDEEIFNYLFKNQKKIFNQEITDEIDIFSDSFNGSLRENKEGKYTLWANIYANYKDEVYDFDNKFFNATGEDDDGNITYEVMNNNDIISTLFDNKETINTNLSIYLRYVWLGEVYSVKWYVAKAQVHTSGSIIYDDGIEPACDEENDEVNNNDDNINDENDKNDKNINDDLTHDQSNDDPTAISSDETSDDNNDDDNE